jgi:hypothetical protein
MADSQSLIIINQYASNVASTRQTYKSLTNNYWSSKYMTAAMTDLVANFGSCLESFDLTERTITIPAFTSIRRDLNSLSSLNTVPSYTDISRQLSQLKRYSSQLDQAVKKHTATLADIKVLENDCRIAQSSLEVKAAELKQTGKEKKVLGATAGILGVLFAPVTFGASLAVGAGAAGGFIESGERAMEKYRTLKSETSTTFTSISKALGSSIEVIGLFAGLISTLSKDLESLSESRTKPRLLIARSKAAALCQVFDRYLALSGVSTDKVIDQ